MAGRCGVAVVRKGATMRDVTMVWLLEWAYRVQRVGDVEKLGCQQDAWEARLSGGGCAIAAGERVDTSLRCAANVHPDAERLHGAVLGLPALARGVVMHQAKVGGVPEWFPGAVVVERYARDEAGQPIRVYNGNRRFVGYKREQVVLVDGQDVGLDPEGLRLARDVYAIWVDGVARLVGVDIGLVSHRVCGVGARMVPWSDSVAA